MNNWLHHPLEIQMKNKSVQSTLELLIDSVHKEKGIPRERLIDVIEKAMCKAAKQWLRQKKGFTALEEEEHDIEARYNQDRGEVEIFEFKKLWKKSQIIRHKYL